MDDHTHSDCPRVYHNGDGPEPPAGRVAWRSADGTAGAGRAAAPVSLAVPVRFALYADSEETEDMLDAELVGSDAFDPASVLMWGLEYDDEALAYRRGNGSGGREHFVCGSAERACALLELGTGLTLRVLYL